jgi:stage IV sporulation protein FB
MRDDSTWSVSLGHWGSVRMRLHLFFILFAALTMYLSWLHREQQPNLVVLASFSLLALFLSVVLHEVGHLAAEMHVGGYVDSLVLGPLGGLHAPNRSYHDPQAELIVSLSGPAMNLAAFLVLLPAAKLVTEAAPWGAFFNPLMPVGVGAVEAALWTDLIRVTAWINWLLFLANLLLPAFPFDGGRTSRAILLMIWPDMGSGMASHMVGRAAVVVAMGLLIAAFFTHDMDPVAGVVPIWFVLVLLSIAMFFSAKATSLPASSAAEPEEQQELFGYDFSQGYTSLERSSEPQVLQQPNFLRRWLAQRKEQRQVREKAVAQQEESQADEILQRLHEKGIQSLSLDDKALLQRVSARYRSRLGQS